MPQGSCKDASQSERRADAGKRRAAAGKRRAAAERTQPPRPHYEQTVWDSSFTSNGTL